ncbi:S2/P23 family protein [Borreliella valaisiana]|uniref:BB0158 famile outer surface lipoprotein n=1 Tax=Borreliella valaisiana TaxID=62088 RepID=UPI003F6D9A31
MLEGVKYSYIFYLFDLKLCHCGLTILIILMIDKYKIFKNSVPISKIIAFEPTKEFEEKYEVKSPKLIFEGLNIDFEQHRLTLLKLV